MRITVMGSGGVGGYFGARLAAAGNDVTFVARGRHLEAMQAGATAVDRESCEYNRFAWAAPEAFVSEGVAEDEALIRARIDELGLWYEGDGFEPDEPSVLAGAIVLKRVENALEPPKRRRQSLKKQRR